MNAIHSKDFTIELWVSNVLDETENVSTAAAKAFARQGMSRLVAEHELEAELFGINATLDRGEGVEITNEGAKTKIVIKPFRPNGTGA